MTTAHPTLRAAAAHAIAGQNSVIKGVTEAVEDAHQKALVRVSGLFNKLAEDIYRELERLEPDEDDEPPDRD